MLWCSVHPSNDGPSGVPKSWSAHSSFERNVLSPTAITYILASRDVFSKTPGDKYDPFEYKKPDLEQKFDNQKTKNRYQGQLLQLTLFDMS